jgi:hypothetical protein
MSGVQLLDCAAEGCRKKVHLGCYQGIILKNKKDGTELAILPNNGVCCTKGCYNTICKSGRDSNRGTWDSDGKNGPEDPNTSMKILLDWMTTEGNYSKFCGKNNHGVKKMQYANQLAEKMRVETSSDTRNSKQVLDKIKRMEEAFRTAHAFATSETGAGIEQAQGQETFQDLVRRKCFHY